MIERYVAILLVIAAGYVLGSVPTGYWYGRLRGQDIRKLGSGNMGATNVLRVFGTVPGIGVLLVDVLKGFLAVALLPQFTPYPNNDILRVVCGLAAILGHSYTLFLNFKGGKSVAVTYGVLLAMAPFATVLVFLIFVGVVAGTKYISAGSLVSAGAFPVLIWLLGESGQHFTTLILALAVGTIIVLRHRDNIKRIMNGTENKFGQRAQTPPGASL